VLNLEDFLGISVSDVRVRSLLVLSNEAKCNSKILDIILNGKYAIA
jgi:hypothetical protein